ncbi:hypothetical protein [Rhizobium sp. CECT 9324]|uniref:hypothetical protein n=1 Tax=Rhizobium sp. CECT 9324 TaxID=2845820 RepID=UPI001E4E33E1|nr:hypothetical protein [Rhizobium sp. CECT 9324]CAH0341927.1 hypothetical protein RHI9324_03635 [Rhizobium sp. CECT 9324]
MKLWLLFQCSAFFGGVSLLIFVFWRFARIRKALGAPLSYLADEFELVPVSRAQIEDVHPDHRIRYYEYYRAEIEREDTITNQRIVWSLTFQGFLINALAVLVGLPWGAPNVFFAARLCAMVAVGVIGCSVSLISLTGILASRQSIRQATKEWNLRNVYWNLYPLRVPQATGQGASFYKGTEFPEKIPQLFFFMWTLFLLVMLIYFVGSGFEMMVEVWRSSW